ncbi:MAG: YceI family protein [Microthrixaceae bacterium]
MKPGLKYGLIAIVLIGLLGSAAAYLFLKDDAPDAVSLDAATESVTDSAAESSQDPNGTPVAIDGKWAVDADSGEFTFDSATGSFAGFRITEELAQIGKTEAVGRTGDVEGMLTIEGTTVTEATFTIDMTTLKSNDSRRDNKIQEALETDQFPTATFTLTEPIQLGEQAASGQEVTVNAIGDLTIHGQTQPVTLPLQTKLVGSTIIVIGSLNISFADYGVEVPTAPIVLSVQDNGPIELQMLFTKA